jgi:hypothetical protein
MIPKKMHALKASIMSSFAPAPLYNSSAAVIARGPVACMPSEEVPKCNGCRGCKFCEFSLRRCSSEVRRDSRGSFGGVVLELRHDAIDFLFQVVPFHIYILVAKGFSF